MKPSLCLNMIVKNEGDRMARCLSSVLPYVKSVVILDTGSTDATVDIIAEMCRSYGVNYHIESGEFKNFSQARNDAFKIAKKMNGKHMLPWCQFALLMDADMELVVDEGYNFDDLAASAASYDMMQKGGSVSYANRRIVNLQVGKDDIYVGVTHEYIDVPANGMIERARFNDYADGSNRGRKYERDARLLEEALKEEPNNGRYWFYLGNTYKDWYKWDKAIEAYDKRIALGGWAEETHQAMMHRAECLKENGFEIGFVAGMMDAYSFRPTRAEPLYKLATYSRNRGHNAAALLFAKAGIKIPRPNDILFVDDFVYSHGLRYEYAVSGYYDEKERNLALQVTDDLALDPSCPEEYRWSARSNLWWFTKPLKDYCPSFKDREINFLPPRGYTAMNPSILNIDGRLVCNVRTVNYKIDEHGRYMIGPKECHDAPIDTVNYLLFLDENLDTKDARQVVWERTPVWSMVTGLEDIRLRADGHEIWFNACVREQCATGTCQQWEGKLAPRGDIYEVQSAHSMTDEHAIEKNWMPIQGTPDYLYRLDKVRYPDGELIKHEAKVAVGDISGGSQVIPFRAGHLCVVHEASTGPDGKRTYWHRFAWLNMDYELRRLSLPFVFLDKQIEFCAGLAYHPNGNDLILSYGVRDAEAHLGTVNIEEVAQMIWKFHEN